jgi:starch synthase
MKILFVSSEGVPYSKTGGLADVIAALPKALVELGHEVAVLLPRYRGNPAQGRVLRSLSVPLGKGMRFPAIDDGGILDGVHYFLLDDPEYFDRPQIYGDNSDDYPDNAQRFAELSRASLEFAKQVWRPDVIHCHDWQTGLVPLMLRTFYAADPSLGNVPVIFTIHNMAYQGLFPKTALAQIGVPDELFSVDGLEYFGMVSYLKAGLLFSDYLTTVSPKYSQEIQTKQFGGGLEGVVRHRAGNHHLVGILNGADYSVWSPEIDTHIAARYSVRRLTGKQACKKDLLSQFGLPAEDLRVPVIGIISRFAAQKGFDLIAEVAQELLAEDMRLVVLGSGERKYEEMFRALAAHAPNEVAAKVAYDDVLAHKIEAGADMFLMPSRYEPCGLNQIYSLRYGTPPIVRATGGLDDTVEEFDPSTGKGAGKGTGFKFQAYNGQALLGCVRQALAAFRDPKVWRGIMRRGMAQDFSWNASAAAYANIYQSACRARIPRTAGASKVQVSG